MLPCSQEICTFQLLLFVINSPNFRVSHQKHFHNSSVMKSLTVWHFPFEYPQAFLGYEPFYSENAVIFFPSQRFSTYDFIYRNAASAILSDI